MRFDFQEDKGFGFQPRGLHSRSHICITVSQAAYPVWAFSPFLCPKLSKTTAIKGHNSAQDLQKAG